MVELYSSVDGGTASSRIKRKDDPHNRRTERSTSVDRIMKLLDGFTLLITGDSGGAVAAAFDDASMSRLLLCASNGPSPSQEKHAEEIFALLRAYAPANAAETHVQLRKMTYTYGAASIKARMSGIWKSLYGDQHTMEELGRAIEIWEKEDDKPVSASDWVPGWDALRGVYGEVASLRAADLAMRMLDETYTRVEWCEEAKDIVLPGEDELEPMCLVAHVLGSSRVLSGDNKSIAQLRRRLLKLGMFWRGSRDVLDWARCQSEAGSVIGHGWVPNDSASEEHIPALPAGVDPTMLMDSLARPWERESSVTLERKFAAMFPSWNLQY
ncbi:hypothetical protein GLOTRDRAFT_129740 [Gloeophyllum trabeum ATCC 11539]|uniref:Uncharacterized protein n=1 Tax=Gloeophyllum trabeum (strain ATCC 11539 / FP-39264 / Madison 617) TaxID=670483 RepID=S7Q7F6_GLOTA|nr:uncharacterized protein GLOTRDRAFT_129740 [Gloeophyllum trabeum ATCC 11539]EPQ55467.1 hypothetical protein GLOTRDRAFT_129740 [Gloeophyllum trabeum ATCC 11539]